MAYFIKYIVYWVDVFYLIYMEEKKNDALSQWTTRSQAKNRAYVQDTSRSVVI